ncbi:MAG: ATP-binding protein [Firmicutes bacterium]|nr:ATP-binding protein [Bacillota bacterium]HOB34160.1 ATP-binding protein [Bacillota bacterium]HPZ90034.1 ATP-binding protein [Bacillota bacterium]HQE00980.1 ATP-binding protein [Bacillota bacterium]
MRDELSHIRNYEADRRQQILMEHEKYMESLYARFPQLKKLDEQINGLKKSIISMTLARLQGRVSGQELTGLEQRMDQLRREKADLLKQFNIDPDSLQPRWNCRACSDTGWVYIDDEHAVPCQCSIEERRRLHQQAAGLPARIADASFDKVNYNLYQPQYREQARRIFEYVKQFCQELKPCSGQGLFIHGPTGSGKSYLLGCIANSLSQRMTVKYVVYADFLDSLRATYSLRDGEVTEQDLIDEVRNVDLLLLDDLGVEKPTEFALKNLAQIIDYRYRYCLPLVVTSNFTLEELIRRSQNDLYGERIAWRLSECCSKIMELKGNLRLNL